MFRGSFEHLIDSKGRVSLPSRFRELVLASGRSEIIITRCPKNPPSRLEAYPIAAWEQFEEQASKLPRFDSAVMLFEDFYIGNAQLCEIDPQGRILVPPALRDWAGLSKEVVFSGARNCIRIWNRASWDQVQSTAAIETQSEEFLAKLKFPQ